MYLDNSAHIKIDGKISPLFATNIGVRQGCVLSPTLFNIFMAELCDLLVTSNTGTSLDGNIMPCLLWADDLMLLSDTKSGLQTQIKLLEAYSTTNQII